MSIQVFSTESLGIRRETLPLGDLWMKFKPVSSGLRLSPEPLTRNNRSSKSGWVVRVVPECLTEKYSEIF